MVPSKSSPKKGSKSIAVRTSGCEKKHVTFVLTIATCGDTLPTMIIFRWKIDHTIKDLIVPDNLCNATQKKTWMDESLMLVWYEKIWLRYVRVNKYG